MRQKPPVVGRGETEVVALGLELSRPAVLDDRKARLRARRRGWTSRALWASCSGYTASASRDLAEDLRLLEQAGMRISPELRQTVIDSEDADQG